MRKAITYILLLFPFLSVGQPYNNPVGSFSNCGSFFYDSGGAGGNYGSSQNRTTTLCSNAGNCIRLTFTAFDLETGYDYLYIYDGPTTASPLLGAFTGVISPGTVTSTTGCLTFQFISDLIFVRPGWQATISCVACPVLATPYDMPSGKTISTCAASVFRDNGGAANYTDNQDRTTTFCSSAGNCMRAVFTSFALENGWDYLTIYDGPNTSSPLIGNYTGAVSPGTVTSTTGCLTFRFTSDYTGLAAGWSANLSCVACPAPPGAPTVYTIPIIFHIIHNGEAVGTGRNISQAMVNSQLQVLNEDFSAANADIAGVPAPFVPAIGNSQIQFCLAAVDPVGAVLAEPGIDRINRNTAGFAAPPYSMAYTDATIKPATFWDPLNYFNLWVADMSGGLLGYAQFPNNSGLTCFAVNNGPANTDGVVVTYFSVGRPPANPFVSPFNLGRTASHEIGHWLGLRHIWGDAGCGTDCVGDTPYHIGSNIGCPPFPWISTPCANAPYGDMWMNYMDYTDDACMFMFTKVQRANMRTVMNVSPRRLELPASTVCSVPAPVELLSFTGKCSGKENLLEWVTASESNSDYFTLERSKDGSAFSSIGTVKSAGNSSAIKNYSFTDTDPLQGKSYYRLSQTDFDGRKETFAPIAVSCGEENNFNVTVNSNPVADGTINLSISAAEGENILLVLTDVLGREIYSKAIVSVSGNFLIAVNPEQKLAQGMYLITASSKDEFISRKIIMK